MAGNLRNEVEFLNKLVSKRAKAIMIIAALIAIIIALFSILYFMR